MTLYGFVKRNWKKLLIYGLAVVYLLCPIDVIPDVPIVGMLDDVAALILAYYLAETK